MLAVTAAAAESPDFPAIYNSQDPKDVPLPPTEAVKTFSMPPGFRVSLFAGEPDVQQPIAFATDSRGRLWVAENYTYAEAKLNFDLRLRDRIIVLEDSRHTGHFDKRSVFWDKGQRLTSVEVGFGGIWALCAPYLLFIPDRDGDGVPDGPPVVVLDGWNDDAVRHNIVNGLRWGPDGWLYGRHGILATSYVGKPGTPASERVPINCGIWRYHPTRHIFEVVASGTTNPWGSDWDDHGEMFFINTVIGHLWHVIPGAHYQRMYGEDFDPHLYDLIGQHADHYHWDTRQSWTASRDAQGGSDALGGGHAHAGLMFYLGNNWPERYRNSLFTINLHGRRLNNDYLERLGSGFVGRHGPDFLKVSDRWFRAVDLIYGSDGGVYLCDWSDVGECHESDGVHRTSGRIYKVTYGQPPAPRFPDVARLSNAQLVKLQLERNDWYCRQARRILQERAAAGQDMRATHKALRAMFDHNPDVTRKLRALWALYVTEGAPEPWLREQLGQPNEYVRAWAVRLLTDFGPPTAEGLAGFVRLGRDDPSGLVRLALASAMQRLAPAARYDLAVALLGHREDAHDHNLPLMLWYGVEPLVAAEPAEGVRLAGLSQIPLVQRYIARRLTEDLEKRPEPVNALLQLATSASPAFQAEVVQGMSEATQGWRQAARPAAWEAFQTALAPHADPATRQRMRDLSVVFGDGRALAELRAVALDATAPPEARRAALSTLLQARPADLLPVLQRLAPDKVTAALALRGLSAYDDPKTPEIVLAAYPYLPAPDQPLAISTLVSRPSFAKALLDAVAEGRLNRREITPYHARQVQNLGDPALGQRLTQVWGTLRATDAAKQEFIAHCRATLTPERLKQADLSQGRGLFQQTCAVCHTLFGQGGKVGPDLTGASRDNLDYLLANVVDPSAVVAADYRMSIITLKDGSVLNGIIPARTARTLTVQTPTDRMTLERSAIAEVRPSSVSLMPEGLLEGLNPNQLANLIAYLMSPVQVALPAGGATAQK